MSDRMLVQRKKVATPTNTTSAIASPTHSTTAHASSQLTVTAPPQAVTQEPANDQQMQSANGKHETPDLQTELERAERQGHHLSRISVHRPQAKLTVGAPGDPYEHEADRMAERVMRMDAPELRQKHGGCEQQAERSPVIQRQVEHEDQEQDHRKRSQQPADGFKETSSNLESRLRATRGGGSALANPVRDFMEPRIGADFRGVRVHTDTAAVQMNRELNAQAFTHGRDIYFGAGKYNPQSNEGKQLLAHELTHVVQQTGAKKLQPKFDTDRKSNKETPQSSKVTPAPALNSPPSSTSQGFKENPQSQAAGDNKASPAQKETTAPAPAQNNQNGSATTAPAPAQNNQNGSATTAPAPAQNNQNGSATTAPAPAQNNQNGSATTAPAPAQNNQNGSATTAPAPAQNNQNGSATTAPAPAQNNQSRNMAAASPELTGMQAASGLTEVAAVHGNGESPASPQKDPAFQAVVEETKGVATHQKNHAPAQEQSQQAQEAAIPPANEVESKAQDKQVQEMDQQQPGTFDPAAFKQALMEKIAAIAPKSEEEADNFKDDNKIGEVKQDVSSQVTEGQQQAKGAIEDKTNETPDTTGIEPKPVTPLPPVEAGPKPPDVGADQAAPKPKTESEVSLQAGSKALDQQMASANITEQQLAKSNEPQFQSALAAKKTAQTHSDTAPSAYRQQEQGILSEAQAEAQTTTQKQMEDMHGTREQVLANVFDLQGQTKGQDEQERTKVANHIQEIYNNTKQKVDACLKHLDDEVNKQFDEGANAAQKVFEDFVGDRMKRYKDDRYSGFVGFFKRIGDAFVGLPDEVNKFYSEGKQQYLDSMGKTIDNIANVVATKLNEAKTEIANGKQEIQKYVASLPESLQQVGQEAAQNIHSKFDELEQNVNSKQDELIDSLAVKYNERLQQIDARIEEMKEENKGLIQKAVDFVVGVAKTIFEMGKLLAQVLARAVSVIPKILTDPIGFLGNLVNGVKQGFQNFVKNIRKHLLQGLMGWLTGALAGAGIQMPESFDEKGIFSLVMQVLGLGYETIRARAVRRLGEEKVSRLETNFEMFKILVAEGVAGLWQYIKDRIGDIKTMVLDTIQNYIIETVIQEGVQWILSLLNPASTFVKACQLIYRIVKFFIERAQQIADLINAILDSITAIANGAIAEAAKAVEDALGKSLPVVISFLASLVGLDSISEKIQAIIQKLRQPIHKAIDWVIEQAVKFAKKIGNGKGKEKGKDGKPDERTKGNDNKQKDGKLDERTEKQEKANDNNDKGVEWRKIKKEFKNKTGEVHTLLFEKKGNSVELMIASKPQRFKEYMESVKSPNIGKIRDIHKVIEGRINKKQPKKIKNKQDRETEIKKEMNNMASELYRITPTTLPEKLPPSKVVFPTLKTQTINKNKNTTSTDGEEMLAKPLSIIPGNTVGSEPSEDSNLWKAVKQRKNTYVRGHLLNHNVHGPGEIKNLTPITGYFNTQIMEKEVERSVKDWVKIRRMVISYKVTTEYGGRAARNHIPEEQFLATKLLFEVYEMKPKNTRVTGENQDDWENDRKLLDKSLVHNIPSDTRP